MQAQIRPVKDLQIQDLPILARMANRIMKMLAPPTANPQVARVATAQGPSTMDARLTNLEKNTRTPDTPT